jgi:hypothetical protein
MNGGGVDDLSAFVEIALLEEVSCWLALTWRLQPTGELAKSELGADSPPQTVDFSASFSQK